MRKTTKMVAVLAAMSVMVLGAATMVSAAEKSGWVKEGSDWYYYVNDKAVKNQWALSGDQWYFLGEQGKMETDAFIDNSIPEVVVDEDTEVMSVDTNDYYYVGADGVMATGWKQIEVLNQVGPTEKDSKAWYYFGANGLMYGETWVLSGDAWYYVNENGKMAKNKLISDWNGDDYYLDGNGVMVTGWYKATDKDDDNNADQIQNLAKDQWIYADKNGVLTNAGWEKVGNAWYYFGAVEQANAYPVSASAIGEEFVMQNEGFIRVEKTRDAGSYQTFYLTKNGAMETGLFKLTSGTTSDYYFANGDGVIQTGAVEVSGRWFYFFTADGTRFDHTPRDAEKYLIKDGQNGAFELLTVTTDADAKAALAAAKTAGFSDAKVYKLGTATMWK